MAHRRLCLNADSSGLSPDAHGASGELKLRPFCLLANDDAQAIKHTTIAFRRVVPGFRMEAVYSAAEALEWVSKEEWPLILFAERLASDLVGTDLRDVLSQLQSRAPSSAIIVLGDQIDLSQGLALAGPAADYYCTPGLGYASSDLAALAMHLIEKRRLRRQLDLTESVLGNASTLLRSLSEYYDVALHEAAAAGRTDMNPAAVAEGRVPKKMVAVQETLNDLIAWLAKKQTERGQLTIPDGLVRTKEVRGDPDGQPVEDTATVRVLHISCEEAVHGRHDDDQ
jgi:hypothetical protein